MVMIPHDTRAQTTFHLTPSFNVAQVYDSNLFYTASDRQADFITRFSPSIESEYRSTPLTLFGRYTIEGERFADQRELATATARQQAAIGFGVRPTRRLALAVDAEVWKTQTPGELNAVTGITFMRARAQRVAAHSSITRQFNPVTIGTIDYMFTKDQVAGGLELRSHAATIGTKHRLSLRDTLAVDYRFHEFIFGFDSDVAASAATSHALGVGWTRAMTRRLSISIDGGPRVTNAIAAPEVSASIRYHLKPKTLSRMKPPALPRNAADAEPATKSSEPARDQALGIDLSLVYARTQTTIIGLAGTADSQSLTAIAAWEMGRSVQVRISPAVYRNVLAGLQADVYRLAIGFASPISNGLSLDISLDGNVQHGNVYAILAHERISRHTMLVRLVAAPATRSH